MEVSVLLAFDLDFHNEASLLLGIGKVMLSILVTVFCRKIFIRERYLKAQEV